MPSNLPARRLRLLWVNHFAVTSADGGGTRHFEFARELCRNGWEVTIAASDFNFQSRVYTRRESASSRETIVEDIDGVRFEWHWAAPYATNDWRRGWNWLTFARSVTSRQRERHFDIVIGSSPHLLAAYCASRLAKRRQIPFVFEVRDLWPESLIAAGGRKGVVYHSLALLAAHLYRAAKQIVVLAAGSREYLVASGIDPERIDVIPNGVATDASPTSRPEASQRPFTLVYTGAHGPANGLHIVLEAARLVTDMPKVRFVLVGDGPAKPDLVRTSELWGLRNVEFRKPVSKAEIPVLLSEADAALMILRDAELFSFGVSPNKLGDYMAAGLPIICNVRGEVAATLAESGAGVQTSDASAEGLARAVRLLASMPASERQNLGNSGRLWVRRERSIQMLAKRLNKLLRSLINA
ncbi:MAG TPA: glycosyltransferase family 4 protein [Gemmatimonadaceae bacterium]|nr:glycosyltransferase family 4 protein [Gemmatimonadaceae bacterium]